MRIADAFILAGAAVGLTAQQPAKPEGARELYYHAMVQKDAPPPLHQSLPRSGGNSASILPASMAAVHLGLRYNLVLVNADTGKAQPAVPDRMFRAGECFAIDFQSNRAGFLYVLAKQSSGTWHPLIPSTDPDMASESNVILPGQKVRIPAKHCFEIQNPPGVETLFVVLSREPRDSFELYENMKSPEKQRQAPGVGQPPVQMASIADGAVNRMREQFGTRDISIKKVSQPLAAAEPVGSVYVVNSSNSPASNVAAQIAVQHR